MKTYSNATEVNIRLSGAFHKHVVLTDDGRTWILKWWNATEEIVSMEIADACGLLTPEVAEYTGPVLCDYCERSAVIVEGKITYRGALIEFLRGAAEYGFSCPDYSKTDYSEWVRLVIVDGIIDNPDRHGGNVLLWQGHIVPIDHGLADFHYTHVRWNRDGWLREVREQSISEIMNDCYMAMRAYLRRSTLSRRQKAIVLRRMKLMTGNIQEWMRNNR